MSNEKVVFPFQSLDINSFDSDLQKMWIDQDLPVDGT
jgi:hypothetical protein